MSTAKAMNNGNFDNDELNEETDYMEESAEKHFKITPVDVQDDTDVLSDDDTELVDEPIPTDSDIPCENVDETEEIPGLESDETDEPENEDTSKVYSTNTPERVYPSRKTIAIDVQSSLSDDELKELAEKMVAIGMQMKDKDDRLELLKSESNSIKKSIEVLRSELLQYVTDYDYGYANRTYSCRRVDNYELHQYEYYDVVSGKLIKTERFQDGDIFSISEEDVITEDNIFEDDININDLLDEEIIAN